jgi:hypothetical protein
MKARSTSTLFFVFKSTIWSLSLYVGCMILMNWDDIRLHFQSSSSAAQSAAKDSLMQISATTSYPSATHTDIVKDAAGLLSRLEKAISIR